MRYLHGLTTSFTGFAFLCRAPALWRYGLLPVLVNMIVALAAWVLTFLLARYAWNSFTDTLSDSWWAPIIEWTVLICLIVVSMGVGFVAYLVLQGIFCSWFFSKLAFHVELHLGARPEDLSDIPLLSQITDSSRSSLKLVLITAALFLLNFMPIVGSVIAIGIGLPVDAYILGSEFLGYPLELRGIRWKQRQQFARSQLASTLGLGTVVAGLMLIPIIGAVFQTTSVVGAVLLHRRLVGLPVTVPDTTSQ